MVVGVAEEPGESASSGSRHETFCNKISQAFSPILLSKYPEIKDEDSKLKKIRHSFLCPPHGRIEEYLTLSFCILSFYGSLLVLLGSSAIPPNGIIFQLIVLVAVGLLAGKLLSFIHFPPLLGMLLTGILFQNLKLLHKDPNIWPECSLKLRGIALAIILLKAGLGLDPGVLRKLSGAVFRLAFLPCCIETVFIGVSARYIMHLPWTWCFLMGFVVSAVSPAVVVPSLLHLQSKGYGVEKGIPTLVIAAASIDDVLAISGFTLLLTVIFENSPNIADIILQVPLEIFVGIMAGACWGGICVFIPSKNSEGFKVYRFIMLFGGSIMGLFGSQKLNIPGAGAISILLMGFVAGVGWKKYGWEKDNYVVRSFSKLWIVFQPLLFVLIGTEIKIEALDSRIVGQCLSVLAIGSAARLIASFTAVLNKEISMKERIFISLAWLPKATVQAAVGGTALDLVNSSTDLPNKNTLIEYATLVLNTAVLVILITAPLGAIAISLLGPRFLKKKTDEIHESA